MKKIVILTDHTPAAQKVATLATKMAARLGVVPVLVEIVIGQEMTAKALDWQGRLKADAIQLKEIMHNDDREINIITDRISCLHPLRFDNMKRADILMIVCYAKTTVDALKGFSHSRNLALLSVPENVTIINWQYIVYASDLQPDDVKLIKKTAATFRGAAKHIQAVHVMQSDFIPDFLQERRAAELRAGLRKLKYKQLSYRTLYGENIIPKLTSYCIENAADMIALNYKQKNMIKRLISGDTCGHLLKVAQLPVLFLNR
ncbi:universal stress protein [Mucilaginibacter conchicola]|nr:universal stress protein [Mucilaginibacter conchicola]